MGEQVKAPKVPKNSTALRAAPPARVVQSSIRTWPAFARQVRSHGCVLLRHLRDFEDPILVTGCQRSGTTVLSRIIRTSAGMVDYVQRRDDELEAGLILAGVRRDALPRGRYCFQTTYLNDCYCEYLDQPGLFRMLWVLRNPYSVVQSMLYNWGRFAFDELFEQVGRAHLVRGERALRLLGPFAIPRVRRACAAYTGKLAQLFELRRHLGPDRLGVVDYDELVRDKETTLARIYRFLDLEYRPEYGQVLCGSSRTKAARLTHFERRVIAAEACPSYERARGLLTL